MASDSAPLSTASENPSPPPPADPLPHDQSFVEPTGSEELPKAASDSPEATQVLSDEEEVFADSEDQILPPDDSGLVTPPPAGGDEGQVSPDDAVPPAVEEVGESTTVDKGATSSLEGDRGVEVSSPGLFPEENSVDGVVSVEDTVQTEGFVAAESVEKVEKDELLGGKLSDEASTLKSEDLEEKAVEGGLSEEPKNPVSDSMEEKVVEGGELSAETSVLPDGMEKRVVEGSELSVEASVLQSDGMEDKVVKGSELSVEASNLISDAMEEKPVEGGELSVEAGTLISEVMAEKKAVEDTELSVEASNFTSEGMVEKKVVEGESREVGVKEGAKDNGELISQNERYEDSMEMEAPVVKVDEEAGNTETGYAIQGFEDEDLKPVVSKTDSVEAKKAEDNNNIDSARNLDVTQESRDTSAVAEETQTTDSHEDSKSSCDGNNVLNTLGAEENGISIHSTGEKEETFADSQMAPAGGIIRVYEAEEEKEEGFVSDGPARVAILESSEAAKQIIEEMERDSSNQNGNSNFVHSREYDNDVDGEIVVESDEEVDTDDDGEGIFDSAALTALLKAAAGASPDEGITVSSQDSSRIFTTETPMGLGSSVSSLKPAAPRTMRSSIFSPSELALVGDDENMNEEERKLHDKVEQIRVKFLRLVQRLGHSPEDAVAAQVLYRLGLAEGIRRGRQTGRSFSLESAKRKALQLEADGKEELDFSCNILVLGKTGVGKSATINSLFGDPKAITNAFQPATTCVKEISGTIEGVKIRIIDTPGLKTSAMEQSSNRKILSSIKKFTKRCPPDIVLYVDRLDTQTRDLNDLPLLRSITSTLGSSIWFNAIVALTHAASAPPDGPNGSPLSYEMFLAQRSHVVQHCIRQAAGDMRLMNPVALVENHPSCRRNREGERVLPNGLSWRPQMLLLCYSSKILSEANSLLKLQDPSPGKLFNFRFRSPPLPFLLSSLLQSRTHPKLPAEQGGENDDSDVELDDLLDTNEEEDEYDQLPPFKPLKKAQIAKLTKEQRKAYFDEYDYRVKLLQKKQWREELRRIKEMKKGGKSDQNDPGYGDMAEDFDQDGAPASVPVPLPDMVLPPSFDCDSPAYRYRFLEPTSQFLTRPVLDTHGWDHDCGYDGVSIEQTLALAGCFPAAIAVQVTKDKKEFSIQLDSSIAAKHGENGSTLAGFDIQSVGRQLAYILRGETKFNNFKKNKTAGGISVTFLGETIATGLKIEDQITIGKRVNLVGSTGAVRAQGDVAFGANMEVRLRDKDYPIGQTLSTLGLSLMKWRSDLALGANLQSQFSVGRNSKMAVRVGLNNKLSGQITVKTSTSDQLQLALLGLLPAAVSMIRSLWPGESYMAH
ncbi:hypothetical protein Cni_G09145 [Canna indica]|uniref:AIG1-type G domain-containing protein n=1 Tax=Canna indica TaxID=4628 RepID=A0AAQ3K244_9LILI|nr:hypothetical protein Cni_G09145 [Canna indica]